MPAGRPVRTPYVPPSPEEVAEVNRLAALLTIVITDDVPHMTVARSFGTVTIQEPTATHTFKPADLSKKFAKTLYDNGITDANAVLGLTMSFSRGGGWDPARIKISGTAVQIEPETPANG